MNNTLKPNQEKKATTITDYKEQVSKSKAIVITNYQGLKHKQLEEMRKLLKKANAQFVVIKNRLFHKALTESDYSIDEKSLDGTTGALFAFEDEVQPIKDLLKTFKDAAAGVVKIGFLGKNALDTKSIEKLATLPPKPVLHAKLVGQLKAPLYGLHNALSWNVRQLVWTLDAVKNKKTA